MRTLSGSRGRLLLFALLSVVALVVGATYLGAGAAQAAPGDRVPVEYSADGVEWCADGSCIEWDGTVIIPGGAPNATTFHVRAATDVPTAGAVYLGNWSVSRGSAWFRVDVDGVEGEPVTLSSDSEVGPGVLMAEFELEAGESALLTVNVGLPAEETVQGASISPGWSTQLTEVEPESDFGPAPGGGSLGLGSVSAAGSVGDVTGSLHSGSTHQSGSAAGSSFYLGSNVLESENIFTAG